MPTKTILLGDNTSHAASMSSTPTGTNQPTGISPISPNPYAVTGTMRAATNGTRTQSSETRASAYPLAAAGEYRGAKMANAIPSSSNANRTRGLAVPPNKP